MGSISYAYDDVGRVVQITSVDVTGRHTVERVYDAFDRVVRRTVGGTDPTDYTYDQANRPLSITFRGQTTTYTWDAAGRLTGKTLPDGIQQSFSYDNANRVTQIQYLRSDSTPIETIVYTYDANGNRTTKTSGITLQPTCCAGTVLPPRTARG
jgi:YD repeat-containing protein